MPPIIQFQSVSKRYNLGLTRTSLPTAVSQRLRRLLSANNTSDEERKFLWALRDVSFSLEKGASLALIGPNGAGKTTILKLLAKITAPTTGRIDSYGRLSALIELGAGFHPDLTGRENIYLNGTILGLKKKEIDQHFDEIVAFSELERFIDTPVKRYSSGMIVRLGFAVAASIQPDILLVDEVLAVGDAAFQQKCLQRIRSLLDNGTTIIFVSHNLYLVQAVCSQALYLQKGVIQNSGKTSDVIHAYEKDLHQMRAANFQKRVDISETVETPSDFEITSIQVTDLHGKTHTDLRSEEPAEIRIAYHAYQDIGDVNVAAYIVRSDGVTCCMLRTSLSNFKPSLHSGEGVITVRLNPLQLISGTYFVEVYFLNDSDSMVLKSSSSDWFDVIGSGLSYEERSGVFEPNMHWDQYEVSRQEFNQYG